MPTTSGLGVRTIADVVQLLTHCSKPQADAAERAIRSSKENIAALAATTGIPIAGVTNSGELLLTPAGRGKQQQSAAIITPSMLLEANSMTDAKRFCHAAIQGSQGKAGDFVSRNIANSIGLGAIAVGTAHSSASGIAGAIGGAQGGVKGTTGK